jgi:hypothetical protein
MIERKKKTCKTCGEEKYIFSKGDCKECAQIRYAAKSKPKRIKLKTRPTKRHKANKDAELAAMQEYWRQHQDKDERCLCSECGTSLIFDRTHVAHVLGKGAYPHLRCNLKNFVILCLSCHQVFDFGERSKMKIYEYISELENELKKI